MQKEYPETGSPLRPGRKMCAALKFEIVALILIQKAGPKERPRPVPILPEQLASKRISHLFALGRVGVFRRLLFFDGPANEDDSVAGMLSKFIIFMN